MQINTWFEESNKPEAQTRDERTQEEAPPKPPPAPQGPGRRVQIFEVAIFLLLIVPSMSASFLANAQGGIGFVGTAVLSMLNDLGEVGLVLYFIWRNSEPLQRIGWTLQRLPVELAWGVVLYFPIIYVTAWVERALLSIGLTAPSKMPSMLVAGSHAQIVLAVLLVIVVAIVEETVFRGYLLLRLEAVTRRPWAAVLLSSLVFSIGHGYEGTAGVIRIFFLGIFLSVTYLWRRSLIAPMVIHFIIDFSSIVLTALLK
jgi:uncharacterized protein